MKKITHHVSLLLCLCLLALPAWAASYTEDFNCADNASLNCDQTWTDLISTAWNILSNGASITSTSSGLQVVRMNAEAQTGNQFSEGTLVTFTRNSGTNLGASVASCRHDNGSTDTYYELQAVDNSGTLRWIIGKTLAGVGSELGTHAQDPAPGDRGRLECQEEGANVKLKGYVNGALLITVTDSSSPITADNHNMVLRGYADHTSAVLKVDDLAFGDYSTCRPGSLMLMGVGC